MVRAAAASRRPWRPGPSGPYRQRAGQEVRWLPRRQASDLALPGNDFWLFDDRSVMLNHFSGSGESVAHEVTDNRALIKLCASAFLAVWERAIPHKDYRPV